MAINLKNPSTTASGVLIGDTTTINGMAGAMPTLALGANGAPVSAALAVQSIEGGITVPIMTEAQKLALNPGTTLTVYQTDTTTTSAQGFQTYVNGAWTYLSTAPKVTQAQRTNLTGVSNGTIVYQTDGTQSFYKYVNGAWNTF